MASGTERRALIVGIDRYDYFQPLSACVKDAKEMCKVLSTDDDDSPNYHCRLLTSEDTLIDRSTLTTEWQRLLNNFRDDVLFYFSGHGDINRILAFVPKAKSRLETA